MKSVDIDFQNYEQLVDLMNHSDEYLSSLVGRNSEDELVITSIFDQYILVETDQNNGWVRKNYYWKDGTVEEMYDGKWGDESPDEDVDSAGPDISVFTDAQLVAELKNRGYKVARN